MSTPLYGNYDPVTQRSTRVVADAETGLPLITLSQNTRPIVESAKRVASSFAGTQPHNITHVARIPMVVWQRLMKTGVAKDEKAMNRWLNERDNRVFRTDDGRKL